MEHGMYNASLTILHTSYCIVGCWWSVRKLQIPVDMKQSLTFFGNWKHFERFFANSKLFACWLVGSKSKVSESILFQLKFASISSMNSMKYGMKKDVGCRPPYGRPESRNTCKAATMKLILVYTIHKKSCTIHILYIPIYILWIL